MFNDLNSDIYSQSVSGYSSNGTVCMGGGRKGGGGRGGGGGEGGACMWHAPICHHYNSEVASVTSLLVYMRVLIVRGQSTIITRP